MKYQGVNNKYVLNLNNETAYNKCSCNCKFYMTDGICMHLVGYSWIYKKISYRNYSDSPTEFAIKKKVGRPKKSTKAGHFN